MFILSRHQHVVSLFALWLTKDSSFFITNDHYFYGGAFGGLLRTFEDKFGPWKWATDVVYCSAAGPSLECKTVSPTNAHPYANGVIVVDDGKTLMVNDVIAATTTIYAIDPETKQLTTKKVVVSQALSFWRAQITPS